MMMAMMTMTTMVMVMMMMHAGKFAANALLSMAVCETAVPAVRVAAFDELLDGMHRWLADTRERKDAQVQIDRKMPSQHLRSPLCDRAEKNTEKNTERTAALASPLKEPRATRDTHRTSAVARAAARRRARPAGSRCDLLSFAR